MPTHLGPHMLRDFDVCMTIDLDIGVNTKFGEYIFYALRKSELFKFIFEHWTPSNILLESWQLCYLGEFIEICYVLF